MNSLHFSSVIMFCVPTSCFHCALQMPRWNRHDPPGNPWAPADILCFLIKNFDMCDVAKDQPVWLLYSSAHPGQITDLRTVSVAPGQLQHVVQTSNGCRACFCQRQWVAALYS